MASEALKPSPTALREIIERLERLEGPDREVDAYIYESLGYTVKRASERITKRYRATFTKSWAFQDPDTRRWLAMDRLTDSLDAAIALVEEMLPGCDLAFSRMDGEWGAALGAAGAGDWWGEAAGPTPAIALLIALFKALEGQKQ